MQRHRALWAVHAFSLKWRALQRRREVRLRAMTAAKDEAIEEDRPGIQDCIDALTAATTASVRCVPFYVRCNGPTAQPGSKSTSFPLWHLHHDYHGNSTRRPV